MSERVQKYLARAGFGSRREIEKWLNAGIIKNAEGTMQPGARVDVNDVLFVNGDKVVVSATNTPVRMLAYHKAEGEICTHKDPGQRRLVQKALPKIDQGRWLSVGRLDINTTGLLLFSNDGGLVHSLMHPSSEIEREYVCRVFGKVSEETLKKLTAGVRNGGDLLRFKSVDRINLSRSSKNNNWFRVILAGGKNREIRRAWQTFGCEVNRLKRVRYGYYELPRELEVGRWIELKDKDIKKFQKLGGLNTT